VRPKQAAGKKQHATSNNENEQLAEQIEKEGLRGRING
jgi:hypothetical protein